jgi:hypothetical protein
MIYRILAQNESDEWEPVPNRLLLAGLKAAAKKHIKNRWWQPWFAIVGEGVIEVKTLADIHLMGEFMQGVGDDPGYLVRRGYLKMGNFLCVEPDQESGSLVPELGSMPLRLMTSFKS